MNSLDIKLSVGLSFCEFEILQHLVRGGRMAQVDLITTLVDFSKSELESAINSLDRKKLIEHKSDLSIDSTFNAIQVLEKYRVKRAIILGAGRGERMRPETASTPKPMVKIGNKSIIETQIEALLLAGIEDIIVIRGYLSEAFDILLEKYPNLQFIDNPRWSATGAVLSASLAKTMFESSYILEGDIFIKNPAIIRPYEYRSSYCGIATNEEGDWYLGTDSSGFIQHHGKGNTYKSLGIMYWATQEAGLVCEDINNYLYNHASQQGFIDGIPFAQQAKGYNIFVRKVEKTDAFEIDTFEELQELRAKL